MVATRRLYELFAKHADEDIDDFDLRLMHPVVEMGQEHLLRYRATLAQAEQFENAVFFAGQTRRLAVYRGNAGVEIDNKVRGLDYRWAIRYGTASDSSGRFVRNSCVTD